MIFHVTEQTLFSSNELRFQELTLSPKEAISVHRGDLLGLHFARYNPITWSAVPCSSFRQRYLRADRHNITPPSTERQADRLRPGDVLSFSTARNGDDVDERLACRQYSFTALMGRSIRFVLLIFNARAEQRACSCLWVFVG